MKTNTITYLAASLFAYLIAGSVVLAHTHAGDLVHHSMTDLPSTLAKTDVSAKAIGDLHNHIDKTTLKNIMKTSGDTASTAARQRDLKPILIETEESILEKFLASLLLFQVALTLRA